MEEKREIQRNSDKIIFCIRKWSVFTDSWQVVLMNLSLFCSGSLLSIHLPCVKIELAIYYLG